VADYHHAYTLNTERVATTVAAAGPGIVLGCMRLSTAADREEGRAIEVLHAAFDAGIVAVDTANAYCRDDTETGHNERLIAVALKTWRGDPARIRIATKGGLTRPHGEWVPDGRARSLIAACEASLRALDIDRIPLYQLHAPDPRVAFATSVRALHALKRDGRIDAIGLCNVTVTQIEEARAITDIAAVQVELNLWNDAAILGGVLDYCVRHDILLLAHRPLGGPERRRRIETDPLLLQLSAAHGATPFEIALAAVSSLAPVVAPVPGSTRPQTATSIARASHIQLIEEDRDRLAEQFTTCRAAWVRDHRHATTPTRESGEVVMIMGLPAAGKSTAAETLVADGYTRVNRDETGGSLRGLLQVFDTVVRSGSRRIVLDNTYVSRKARGAVIQAARQHGLPIRCVWVTTGIDDAQVNAVSRIVSRYGRLLEPEELKKASRQDVAAFGPAVQFRYHRELEPPDLSEGFSRVDVVPFERRPDPDAVTRAVIVWCDGVLLRSRSDRRVPVSPSDVEVFQARGMVLRRYAEDGWRILGLSWLPEIAEQTMSADDAEAVFARMRERLGVDIEVEHCPHPAGPPICWCRRPLPGLGVVLVKRHHLDPCQSIYVGTGPQDPGFARKLGVTYRQAEEFFAS
jgi:aryl-alcohol dehydrogenase-like predicted oxidoreductase/histidinol phosphatase-like enzyme